MYHLDSDMCSDQYNFLRNEPSLEVADVKSLSSKVHHAEFCFKNLNIFPSTDHSLQ